MPRSNNLQIDVGTNYLGAGDTYDILRSVDRRVLGFNEQNCRCVISYDDMNGPDYQPTALRLKPLKPGDPVPAPSKEQFSTDFYNYPALIRWIEEENPVHPMTRQPLTLDNILDFAVRIV